MVGINKPCCNRFKQTSLVSRGPTTKEYSLQTLIMSLIPINPFTQYQFMKRLKHYKANDYIRQKGPLFDLGGSYTNTQRCSEERELNGALSS